MARSADDVFAPDAVLTFSSWLRTPTDNILRRHRGPIWIRFLLPLRKPKRWDEIRRSSYAAAMTLRRMSDRHAAPASRAIARAPIRSRQSARVSAGCRAV